jgi:hypothetical protein
MNAAITNHPAVYKGIAGIYLATQGSLVELPIGRLDHLGMGPIPKSGDEQRVAR